MEEGLSLRIRIQLRCALTEGDEFDYVVPLNVAAVSMFVAAKAGLARRSHDVGLGALLCNIGIASPTTR